MADRTHKTRQKLTFRVPVAKPRNPLVAPALKRAAGAHRRSASAVRASERKAIERALKDDDSK